MGTYQKSIRDHLFGYMGRFLEDKHVFGKIPFIDIPYFILINISVYPNAIFAVQIVETNGCIVDGRQYYRQSFKRFRLQIADITISGFIFNV